MQQASYLLQLFALKFQQEIQIVLESNPLLEQADLHDEVEAHVVSNSELLDTHEAIEQENIPEKLLLDIIWNKIYLGEMLSGTDTDYRNEESSVYQSKITQILQDYLV